MGARVFSFLPLPTTLFRSPGGRRSGAATGVLSQRQATYVAGDCNVSKPRLSWLHSSSLNPGL
jgi:hypothetical protein